jgi:hypothetical protein
MLVVVAVLLVVVRSWLERPRADDDLVADANVAMEPEGFAIPAVEQVVDQTTGEPSSPAVAPVIARTEPLKVALLPVRVEGRSDPAAEIQLNAIRWATVRALRGMADIEVIDVSPAEFAVVAPPNAGLRWVNGPLYLAVAGQYESGTVAEISVESRPEDTSWSIRLQVTRQRGGINTGATVSKDSAPAPGNDAESIGIRFAEEIADDDEALAAEANASLVVEARNVFIDETRSEQERVRALATMRRAPLDSETVTVAIELARRSESAETRRQVWELLRQRAANAALAQPLGDALLSDPDAAVRREAALALAAYVGDSGALAILEHAAISDSSADVRIAAHMSTMDNAARRAFASETLLDRSLTSAERLAPTRITGPVATPDLDDGLREEALALAEIVEGTDDSELKLRGLKQLRMATLFTLIRNRELNNGSPAIDPAITKVLIESADVEDGRVRRAALEVLSEHVQVPEVRAKPETPPPAR